MSTLTELGDFLESQALGVQGEDIFLGSRPDEPDTLIALALYPGGAPEYVQDSDDPSVEFIQLQVVTRAPRYEAADRLASMAWQQLARVKNMYVSGTWYRSIKPNSSPSIMGRDSNDRILIVFNATVQKEVSLAF